MGTREVRQRETEQTDGQEDQIHRNQENAEGEGGEGSDFDQRLRQTGDAIHRTVTLGTSVTGAGASGTSDSSFVDYDSGPDHQAMRNEYDVDFVRDGQAAKLQRLEQEHGSSTVQRWADEGMTVETMGKPRDMAAFRSRQESRSEEIPTDVERTNQASLHRNKDADSESSPAGTADTPDVVRNVISSPGKSMDEAVQREMESKMGGDFSDVQIHTGPQAAAAADSINARAFTVGNHVAFNKGEYDPGSNEGKKVMAHELTHVCQQTEGRVSLLSKADADRRGAPALHVQPKLEVSSPDDPAEKEAERMAEAVIRMPEGEGDKRPPSQGLIDTVGPSVGRSVQGGRQSGGGDGDALENQIGSLGSGRPLPDGVRSEFEGKMGRDFSGVRVHTGDTADEVLRSINAKAFTHGFDIAFKSGNYDPDSRDGKKLLAHELTHVIQQESTEQDNQNVHRRPTGDQQSDTEEEPETGKRIPGPGVEGDITGTWEETSGYGEASSTLSLNQAGEQITGWYSWREKKKAATQKQQSSHKKRTAKIEGSLEGKNVGRGRYLYLCHGKDGWTYSNPIELEVSVGSSEKRLPRKGGGVGRDLGPNENTQITVRPRNGKWQEKFEQKSSDPVMSDRALEEVDQRKQEEVTAAERFPLSTSDEELIDQYCEDVKDIVDSYKEGNLRVDDTVSKLNKLTVEQLSIWAGQRRKNDQFPLVRAHIKANLTSSSRIGEYGSKEYWQLLREIGEEHSDSGVEREYLDFLELTVSGAGHAGSSDEDTPGHPDIKTPYLYKWRYNKLSAPIEAPGIAEASLGAGKVSIEKEHVPKASGSSRPWENEYLHVMAEGKLEAGGVGASVGEWTKWQPFYTTVEWTPDNFEGTFSLISAGAGPDFAASLPPDVVEDTRGLSEAQDALRGASSYILFNGNGEYDPCYAPKGDGMKLGLEVGGSGGGASLGYMKNYRQIKGKTKNPDDIVGERSDSAPPSISAESYYGTGTVAGFPVDGHELSNEALAEIEKLCAENRELLLNSETTIRLQAHTSTTASDEYNMELAKKRARSVKQAIMESLPKTEFEVSGAEMKEQPVGESMASLFIEDDVETGIWRVVQIYINGRLRKVIKVAED